MYILSTLDHQEKTLEQSSYNKKIQKDITTISQEKHI